MLLNNLTLAIADADMPAVLIGFAIFIVVIVGTVMKTVQSIHRTNQREETRREIAAYVAEGTISPNDAERLLTAGERDSVEIGKNGIHIQG